METDTRKYTGSDLVRYADQCAASWHAGQVRKHSGVPYIEHPRRMVLALQSIGVNNPSTLAAALLHDVVEDCDVSFQYLRGLFSDTVVEYVWWLTSDKSDLFAQNNRATRKWLANVRLAAAPAAVVVVKLADFIDNGDAPDGIRLNDPNFWSTFKREATDFADRVRMRQDYRQVSAIRVLHERMEDMLSK